MNFKWFTGLFLLLMLGIQCNAFAQNEKILKYRKELKEAVTDSVRARLNYKIAVQYRKSDYDQAMEYGRKSLDIAKKSGYIEQEAKSLQLIGLIYKYQGDYQHALNYYNRSLETHRKANNADGEASILNNIGVLYKNMGKLDSALILYDQAEKIYKKLGDQTGIARLNMNRGVVMKHKGALEEAARYYIKALKVYEQKENYSSITRCYNNLGVLYRMQGLDDQAMEYYRKALEINKERGVRWQVAKGYTYIGSVYAQSMDKPDSALYYYEKALEINKELGDKNSIANLYINISNNYEILGEYDKALDYLLKAKTLSEKVGNQMMILYTMTNLGELYSRKGQHEKALDYLHRGLKLAGEKQEFQDYMNAHHKLAYAYKRKGEPDKAFEYLNRYYSIKDSVMGGKTKEKIAELQTMYESEKKENQIAMLKKKEELQTMALRKKQITNYAFMGGMVLVIILAFFIFRNYRQKKNHAKSLESQNQAISHKNAIIEEKNKDVMDSIKYAKRLQEAILPPPEMVENLLPESFVLYKPKDIVSGDFYWVKQKGEDTLFAAVDCTGHGVPGAFMSIVGYNGLNNAVNEQKLRKPCLILDRLNDTVAQSLNQGKGDSTVKDGMDAALCRLNASKNHLQYAGAMNPLYIIRKGELKEIKADKHSIGAGRIGDLENYTCHDLELEKGDCLYIFTDGFADQFGGTKGKKFKYRPFKELLVDIHQKPMTEQQKILDETIEEWRGELEQVDDICIFGIRIA